MLAAVRARSASDPAVPVRARCVYAGLTSFGHPLWLGGPPTSVADLRRRHAQAANAAASLLQCAMDLYHRGRWTARMTGAAGAAAAAATAAVAITAVAAAAMAATAVVAAAVVPLPPLSASAGEPLALPAPAVRALGVASVGDADYHIIWEISNNSVCPRTFSIGSNTPVSGVPSAGARLYPGDSIREGTSNCTGGGLLAVAVDVLGDEDTMTRLGEAGVAALLTSSEVAGRMLDWADIVGLRMSSLQCGDLDQWPPDVYAFFGDSYATINTGSLTTLPAGQRHMVLASPTALGCVYRAQAAPDRDTNPSGGGGEPGTGGGEEPGTGGGGVVGSRGDGGPSRGAFIGVCVAAAVVVAAASATTLVVWRRNRRGAGGDQGGPTGGVGAAPPAAPPLAGAPPGLGAAATGCPAGPPAVVSWPPPASGSGRAGSPAGAPPPRGTAGAAHPQAVAPPLSHSQAAAAVPAATATPSPPTTARAKPAAPAASALPPSAAAATAAAATDEGGPMRGTAALVSPGTATPSGGTGAACDV